MKFAKVAAIAILVALLVGTAWWYRPESSTAAQLEAFYACSMRISHPAQAYLTLSRDKSAESRLRLLLDQQELCFTRSGLDAYVSPPFWQRATFADMHMTDFAKCLTTLDGGVRGAASGGTVNGMTPEIRVRLKRQFCFRYASIHSLGLRQLRLASGYIFNPPFPGERLASRVVHVKPNWWADSCW